MSDRAPTTDQVRAAVQEVAITGELLGIAPLQRGHVIGGLLAADAPDEQLVLTIVEPAFEGLVRHAGAARVGVPGPGLGGSLYPDFD